MNTVKLKATLHGVEVECAECGAKLDRVPTETVAYNRVGQYAAHKCKNES
jgi:hypothetical protein